MSFSEIVTYVTQNPDQIAVYVSAVIGAAAFLAKAIELITGITASDKDDVYASKFTKIVATIKGWADKFGLNPKQ